jgi:hypothetical protein
MTKDNRIVIVAGSTDPSKVLHVGAIPQKVFRGLDWRDAVASALIARDYGPNFISHLIDLHEMSFDCSPFCSHRLSGTSDHGVRPFYRAVAEIWIASGRPSRRISWIHPFLAGAPERIRAVAELERLAAYTGPEATETRSRLKTVLRELYRPLLIESAHRERVDVLERRGDQTAAANALQSWRDAIGPVVDEQHRAIQRLTHDL